LPNPCDFKTAFVGDTSIVLTPAAICNSTHSSIDALIGARWSVARRVAIPPLTSAIYHQWSYNLEGNLIGVPFRRGSRGTAATAPISRPPIIHCNASKVDSCDGLIFVSFCDDGRTAPRLLGADMRSWLDRTLNCR